MKHKRYRMPRTVDEAAELYEVAPAVVERFAAAWSPDQVWRRQDWPSIAGVPFFELDALPIFAWYLEHNARGLSDAEVAGLARAGRREIARAAAEARQSPGGGRRKEWLQTQRRRLARALNGGDRDAFLQIWEGPLRDVVGTKLRQSGHAWWRDSEETRAFLNSWPTNGVSAEWVRELSRHQDLNAMLASLDEVLAERGKRGRPPQAAHDAAVALLCDHRKRLTGHVGYTHNDGRQALDDWKIRAFADRVLALYGLDREYKGKPLGVSSHALRRSRAKVT